VAGFNLPFPVRFWVPANSNAILGFSKFFRTDPSIIVPYQYQPSQVVTLQKSSWTVPDPVTLDIMKKRLTFRRLNADVLTNLQLFKDYQRISSEPAAIGLFDKGINDSLSSPTPSLEDVNKMATPWQFAFLCLVFNLDTDYSKFFGPHSLE
jgi:hypothetical protein